MPGIGEDTGIGRQMQQLSCKVTGLWQGMSVMFQKYCAGHRTKTENKESFLENVRYKIFKTSWRSNVGQPMYWVLRGNQGEMGGRSSLRKPAASGGQDSGSIIESCSHQTARWEKAPLGWALSDEFFFFLKIFYYCFFLRFYLFIFREGKGGRKRGRETPCTRDTLIGCLLHTPNRGPGLQPRHVPWLGLEPGTSLFTGRVPNPLNHTSQGEWWVL